MIDKNKITQQAKKIMDSFMLALDKAGKGDAEFEVKRNPNIRDEKVTLHTNDDFQERMFKNAPKTKDGYICAETLESRRRVQQK